MGPHVHCTFKGKIKSCKIDHSWRENRLRATALIPCDTQDDPRSLSRAVARRATTRVLIINFVVLSTSKISSMLSSNPLQLYTQCYVKFILSSVNNLFIKFHHALLLP